MLGIRSMLKSCIIIIKFLEPRSGLGVEKSQERERDGERYMRQWLSFIYFHRRRAKSM
jgi:hypothetical protein